MRRSCLERSRPRRPGSTSAWTVGTTTTRVGGSSGSERSATSSRSSSSGEPELGAGLPAPASRRAGSRAGRRCGLPRTAPPSRLRAARRRRLRPSSSSRWSWRGCASGPGPAGEQPRRHRPPGRQPTSELTPFSATPGHEWTVTSTRPHPANCADGGPGGIRIDGWGWRRVRPVHRWVGCQPDDGGELQTADRDESGRVPWVRTRRRSCASTAHAS